MPLYDFRCTHCAHVFERLVRAGELATCPQCGAVGPERLLSRPAAPGTSAALISAGRAAAAREGHFSHYSRSERARIKG